MATVQHAKGEEEADLISKEIQHTTPPSENTDLENQKLGDEQLDEPLPVQNECGSFCMPIRKTLRYLLIFLLCVCLAPVAYACVTAATVGILPLILAAFVVIRVLQFVIRSENFGNHVVFIILLRYWILVAVILLLIEAGIFYPIAKYDPELKLIMIIGLPITKWIKLICIVSGIYLLSQVVWIILVLMIVQVTITDEHEKALVVETISEIIGCLLLRWAEAIVMSSVPTFKQSKIFRIYTQKWIEASIFLLIGYNIITLFTHIVVWSLPKFYGDHLDIGKKLNSVILCDFGGNGAFNKRYIVYVTCGLKRSIIFILSAVMLLLTWVLHFGDYLNTTSKDDKDILEFGTWTLLSILVCSFLWLIKSCILLYWEAHTVYDRLHTKIEKVGKQLYFLVLLSYNHFQRVFESPHLSDPDDSTGCVLSCSTPPPKKLALWVLLESSSEGEEYKDFERKTVRKGLLENIGSKASIYDIQQAAQRFLSAQYILSKESMFSDLHHLQSDNSRENNTIDLEMLNKIVQEVQYPGDWEMLLGLLPPAEPTMEDIISIQRVKTWMERAHNRCRLLANMLISETEVVKSLNQVISGLIFVVTFVMWLLLTGLAKTNVLVLIASPLLAATFIFGDTCKSLFQGLIFVYVVHPFDVGDLCVIDDKLMEVKRIGVWSTIFSKVRTVGKDQEVIYPNSVLATKNVINHKTNFDWTDRVEFSINSLDKETTKKLKLKIDTYIDTEKKQGILRFIPNYHSVEFIRAENIAKIVIHIKHNSVQTEGWTAFECLKEKEKRTFEFAIDIQNLVHLHEPPTKDAQAGTSIGADQTLKSEH